jgi:hypothetical protein
MLIVIVLMAWRIRTHVNGTVAVGRVRFVVAGENKEQEIPILSSTGVRSLALERFSRIQFAAKTISVADPEQYLLDQDRYPASAWRSLKINQSSIAFESDSQDADPRVTFENLRGGESNFGRLDEIRGRSGSEVIIETKDEGKVNIYLEGSNGWSTSIVPEEEVQIVADHSRLDGVTERPFKRQSLTYRARFPQINSVIDVDSQGGTLLMVAKFGASETPKRFAQHPIPVVALDFTRRDTTTGDVVTAITEGGEVNFPGYEQKKIHLGASDHLLLNKLEKFTIQELNYKPSADEILVHFDGITDEIKTGPGLFLTDSRVTAADYLRYSNWWVTLFAVVSWVVVVAIAGFKFYKEL